MEHSGRDRLRTRSADWRQQRPKGGKSSCRFPEEVKCDRQYSGLKKNATSGDC